MKGSRVGWSVFVFLLVGTTTAAAQITRVTVGFEKEWSEYWTLQAGWQVKADSTRSGNSVLQGVGPAWAVLKPGLDWRDFTLRFRYQLEEGQLRACFRVGPGGRYVLGIAKTALSLDRVGKNGSFRRLREAPAPKDVGGWHTAVIGVENDRIQVSIDHASAIELRDESPNKYGGIAFEVPDRSSALIDDVEVSVDALAEVDPDAAGIEALVREGERLCGTSAEYRQVLEPLLDRLRGAAARRDSSLRQAEQTCREALASALWGELQRAGGRRISDDQREAMLLMLDRDETAHLNTSAFMKRVEKVKSKLLSGSGDADLTVSLWSIPGSTQTGLSPYPPLTDRPTLVTILVENDGFKSVDTSFDTTLQLDGTLVKTWTFSPVAAGEDAAHSKTPLLPGGSRMYSTSLEIKAGGSHTLKVDVDPKNVISETDDSNNTAQLKATWQDPPNLKVRSITAVGVASAGQKSTWKIEIENAGKGDAIGPFLTVFWPAVAGGAQENFYTTSLAAGATTSFTSNQWFNQAGTFTLSATVDASWAVAEALPDGEKDNEFSQSVTLAAVDFAVTGMTVTPKAIVSWSPMTISVTVKNNSTVDAKTPFKVRIYPGTVTATGLTQPKDVTVPSLKAGASKTLTNSVTLRPGRYDVTINVDPDAVYLESNEANNTKVSSIDCQGMYDGRLYVTGDPTEEEMITYVNNDPKLASYRKKVVLTGLAEAAVDPPICGDDAEDRYDASGSWCSEFVRWILLQSGMQDINYYWFFLSGVTLNKQLVVIFDGLGQFRWRQKGEVTPQTLEPGDYMSQTTFGKKKNHGLICAAVSQDNKYFWGINGNCDGCVCFQSEDYFADGKTCNPDIDGIGKLKAGWFPP